MVARKNNIIATIKKNNVVKHQSANIVCFFLTCSVSVFFVGVATVDLERHGVPHVDTYLQTTTATDHIAHLCTMCIYTYIHGGKHSPIYGTPLYDMTWFPVPIWLETLISCGNGLQFWSWVAEENRTNGLKPKPSSTYLAFHHVTKQSDMIFSAEVQPYPDYPSQPCIQDLNIPELWYRT